MKIFKSSKGGKSTRKSRKGLFLFIGVFVGFALFVSMYQATVFFSSNQSCMMCHMHPHADESWRMGIHGGVVNSTGVMVSCVDCHLPPRSQTWAHYTAKARHGINHVWGWLTNDTINWDRGLTWDEAVRFVYNQSCMECHTNLLTPGLSSDGINAHLHFMDNHERLNLQCISCHMNAGHYDPNFVKGRLESFGLPTVVDSSLFYIEPAIVTAFANFTEQIPGTAVSFNMIAIPGGRFMMGSPANEPFRQPNEGPQHEVEVSPFFMSEIQVTWDMFNAFFGQTRSEGRTDPELARFNNSVATTVDGLSGPTAPWGNPDQGWGDGERPAITITRYAAQVFTQWLSMKTGRNYRLPTEAEWEFAARGGTDTPYFFPGSPRDFAPRWFRRNPSMEAIAPYVIFNYNSSRRTHLPDAVRPNPFGLRHMLGNVFEYVLDVYDPNAFEGRTGVTVNPLVTTGPVVTDRQEYVIRGGFFDSDAAGVRVAARTHTRYDDWLRTDPQMPKSIWWFSDFRGIGFRVVMEPDAEILRR